MVNTRNRSEEQEIMDDFSMEGKILEKSLSQIALINKRLGGNTITLNGLRSLIGRAPKGKVISIADLGCGNGDLLRAAADFGRKNNISFKLTGIDANDHTIKHARTLSVNYPEISYQTMNITPANFSGTGFDIVFTTLFLHHFTDREIELLLIPLVSNVSTGVVINDLHRSKAAYYLFKLVCLFIANPVVKKDGAISVLRGFKKAELVSISKKLNDSVSTIRWRWAFRYQWIIKKV